MLDKRRQEKIRPIVELEKTFAEIPVANGRAVEPFVKVFRYSDDNVIKSQLGELFGVFEIAEQSEDSAYIVNFLASVAKKEYFSNPRRGAIESFEAALHKINLALAELVKHGNIAWLGKFHGALSVLEKNNFHFSVAGDAKILLLRNTTLSEISADLASEESDLHPIKTFVEISSGRTLSEDKILLTSPDVVHLLPLDLLKKNALRMDNERFIQFVRTALVNELERAGTIIVDIEERRVSVPVTETSNERFSDGTHNVFSQKAFEERARARALAAVKPSPTNTVKTVAASEYVDSKTGHIYVQGSTTARATAHPRFERMKLSLQETSRTIGSFLSSKNKLLRRGKKQMQIALTVMTGKGLVTTRKLARAVRRQWQKTAGTLRSKPSSVQPLRAHTPAPMALPAETPHLPSDVSIHTNTDLPDFMKEKLSAFYKKNHIPKPPTFPVSFFTRLRAGLMGIRFIHNAAGGRAGFQLLWQRFLRVTRGIGNYRNAVLIGGTTVLILAIGMFFWIRSADNIPVPTAETPQTPPPAFPLETEKNAQLLEPSVSLATRNDRIVTAALLDNDLYVITVENIVNVRESKEYRLPADSGAIISAAPMDDLHLLFLYTDAGALFAWSPINHTFVKNSLALPPGAIIRDIDTYLTYLYVLDGANNQVYRFPRAEGGFGAPSLWLRDPVTFETDVQLAVNETIFIAPNKNIVQAFFRGRFTKDLELPNTPLAITYLFTRPGFANIYALDTENKRLLVWSQDGALIAQYFSEHLAGTQTLTVNEQMNEAFLTTSSSLFSVTLNLGQ